MRSLRYYLLPFSAECQGTLNLICQVAITLNLFYIVCVGLYLCLFVLVEPAVLQEESSVFCFSFLKMS